MVNALLLLFPVHSMPLNASTLCGKKNCSLLYGLLNIFALYLLNHEFLVKSDNKPSTQLLVNSALKLSTSATNRVIRWILSIQAYNFKVEHQAGKTNVVADALSRFAAHINAIPDDFETAEFCQLQTSPQPHTKLFDSFQDAYKTDTRFAPIYQQLSDGTIPSPLCHPS